MGFDKVKFLASLKAMKESFAETAKFMDYKLKDGAIIRYEAEKLDIGVAVMAVTEEGAIAMPDGDFELEDGTKFTIVGGIVSAVTPIEEAPKEEGDAKAAPSPAAAMTEAGAKAIVESIIKETRFAEEIEELKKEIAEFKTVKENFSTQKDSAEKEINSLKETVKGLFELVETIAAEPNAEPAEKKKESFSVSEFRKSYKEDLRKLSEQAK